jgi:hypothetical protein
MSGDRPGSKAHVRGHAFSDSADPFADNDGFSLVESRTYRWERTLSADEWVGLAATVSDHQRLVHALLRHLEEVGFEAAPRVVGSGFEPDGRETLTFIHGDFIHPGPWTLDGATSVGVLLRQLHDATTSLQIPADAVWYPWFGRGLARGAGVIGHCDVAPWNIVARDGRAAGRADTLAAARTTCRRGQGQRPHLPRVMQQAADGEWLEELRGEGVDGCPHKRGGAGYVGPFFRGAIRHRRDVKRSLSVLRFLCVCPVRVSLRVPRKLKHRFQRHSARPGR